MTEQIVQDTPTTTAPVSVPVLVTPIVDHNDLREWQKRRGFTYDEAAQLLDIDRSTYAAYLSGKARTSQQPVPLPRPIALAAMAIDLGIHKLLPPPVRRVKKRRIGTVGK